MTKMLRNLAMAALVVVGGASCTEETSIQGTWDATTFTYAKTGSAPVDVLAAGGSIHLEVASNLSIGNRERLQITVPVQIDLGAPQISGYLDKMYQALIELRDEL